MSVCLSFGWGCINTATKRILIYESTWNNSTWQPGLSMQMKPVRSQKVYYCSHSVIKGLEGCPVVASPVFSPQQHATQQPKNKKKKKRTCQFLSLPSVSNGPSLATPMKIASLHHCCLNVYLTGVMVLLCLSDVRQDNICNPLGSHLVFSCSIFWH